MLRHAGLHIGETLNVPLDNLWFTVLFKRQDWTRRRPDPAEVAVAVRLFVTAMTLGLDGRLAAGDRALVDGLRRNLPPEGQWRVGAQGPHAEALAASRPGPGPRAWGWKEPNTHIFLPDLDRRIAGLRYVHVIRDGLDMAFSKNVWQALHWGHLFGLSNTPEEPMPVRQLRFWTAANRAALDYGTTHMPGRFLVMRYEDVCAEPERCWRRFRRFLGLPGDAVLAPGLLNPTSIGRSKSHDLSLFPPDLGKAAAALQSEAEALSAGA